jgi:hypothetical protein
MTRQVGIYTVTIEVLCSRAPCSAEDQSSVRATSCEDARQGAMKVLRYKGWIVGNHHPTTCPRHTGPMEKCARCGDPTPAMYLEPVRGAFYRDLPELASYLPDGKLCTGCQHWAREIRFSQLRAEASR